MTDRKGSWIQTFTGRQFWPLDPRPEDVDIRDIAHALANCCRFSGHVRKFYSVAQHSVIASQVVPWAARLALLHDAAEAYMGDIARPWKQFLWVDTGDGWEPNRLKECEHSLLSVILGALGVAESPDLWAEVKRADDVLLATEARDLMSPLHPDWRHCEHRGATVLPQRIDPWPPSLAEKVFLRRWEELGGIPLAAPGEAG